MQTFDAIVVGTGGVGSAAAMHLAARGASVLGLDRFPPGHDRGSSHGQTRVIRMAYYEHPDYVPLLRRAYQLWETLEQVVGEKLYYEVGLLQVGPPDGPVLSGARASALKYQLELESLSAEEVSRRFPGLVCHAPFEGVFERHAGYLAVEACVVAHAKEAVRYGAQLHEGETVISWRPDGEGVQVETDRAVYAAKRLIVTAGAWTRELMLDLGVPLEVLRKPLYWFAPKADAPRNTNWPCYLYDLPEGCFYGSPQLDDRGVKVAQHSGGDPVTNPLQVDRSLDENDCDSVKRFVKSYLPTTSTNLTAQATCMYTMTPDKNFIVGKHPRYPQVSFAAGLSGHGFKFTGVLGEILSELALDDATKLPIEFLSPARFS